MRQIIVQRWFLIVLCVLVTSAFSFPGQLQPITEGIPREAIVASVLFLMALPLQTGAMWKALRYPGAVSLAVCLNYGMLPLVAWGVSSFLSPDMSLGLVIAAASPSTLASASVWTRRAGGNDAVSLMVTMITNLFCFLATPLWLHAMTSADVEFDSYDMVQRLCLLVVVPTFGAQLLRLYRPLGTWATARKLPLGVLAQGGVLTMIFIGSVKAGSELAARSGQIGPFDWVTMLAAVVGVHLAILVVGHLLGRTTGIRRADRIAIGFSGSQKTLMIGLHVALEYFPMVPLAVLPAVAYHVSQLFVDTIIADGLRKRAKATSPEP